MQEDRRGTWPSAPSVPTVVPVWMYLPGSWIKHTQKEYIQIKTARQEGPAAKTTHCLCPAEVLHRGEEPVAMHRGRPEPCPSNRSTAGSVQSPPVEGPGMTVVSPVGTTAWRGRTLTGSCSRRAGEATVHSQPSLMQAARSVGQVFPQDFPGKPWTSLDHLSLSHMVPSQFRPAHYLCNCHRSAGGMS